mmetsp:Transcript_8923/g.21466  ORF Transcript_8923/g.21466 Transcript_8923/m.21466 type:complete len:201 (+) Transcript_8923:744-1346(+)
MESRPPPNLDRAPPRALGHSAARSRGRCRPLPLAARARGSSLRCSARSNRPTRRARGRGCSRPRRGRWRRRRPTLRTRCLRLRVGGAGQGPYSPTRLAATMIPNRTNSRAVRRAELPLLPPPRRLPGAHPRRWSSRKSRAQPRRCSPGRCACRWCCWRPQPRSPSSKPHTRCRRYRRRGRMARARTHTCVRPLASCCACS